MPFYIRKGFENKLRKIFAAKSSDFRNEIYMHPSNREAFEGRQFDIKMYATAQACVYCSGRIVTLATRWRSVWVAYIEKLYNSDFASLHDTRDHVGTIANVERAHILCREPKDVLAHLMDRCNAIRFERDIAHLGTRIGIS